MSTRASLNPFKQLRACAFAIAAACTGPTAGDTVALGDNFELPEINLNDDFFYCEIQPNVITAQRCAEGGSEDTGGCHTQRSALRLVAVDTPSRCQNGRVIGAPTPEAEINLTRVRTTLSADVESSQFYRRPLGLDSHPRAIFNASSPEAALIRAWLSGSGS